MPPQQEKRIFIAGRDGTICFGARELTPRLNPPQRIQLAGMDDATGQHRLIVNCKRAIDGKGLCGPNGPACYFTPLAQANLDPQQREKAGLIFENQRLRDQLGTVVATSAASIRRLEQENTDLRQTADRLTAANTTLKRDLETARNAATIPTTPEVTQETKEPEETFINRRTVYGEVTLDTESHVFRISDRELTLLPRHEEIMLVLLRNHGEWVSKETLHEAVRNRQIQDKAFPSTSRQMISNDIRYIRRELGEEFQDLIQTDPDRHANQGYRIANPEGN